MSMLDSMRTTNHSSHRPKSQTAKSKPAKEAEIRALGVESSTGHNYGTCNRFASRPKSALGPGHYHQAKLSH